jgi:alpha,alpha-trehalase
MSAWSLIYEGYDPEEEGLREALCTLGNGYFCTRGAAPEAAADSVHYPGTYLAGGYNRLKTEITGHIVENEDLVNLPDWTALSFRIDDDDWFDLAHVDILSYRQELDIQQGLLRRDIRFEDRTGRVTRLASRRLVHMRFPHLAALEINLKPENWSGSVEIRSALDGRIVNDGVPRYRELNGQHLQALETELCGPEEICLIVETSQSHLKVAEAARTRIFRDHQRTFVESRGMEETGYVARLYRVEVPENSDLRIEKTVSLFTSRDPAISECGLAARQALARAGSFADLLQSHVLAWQHLWRAFDMAFTDREAQRGEEIGRIMHLHIFHLLQTASINTMNLDLDVGVPSRGWHGEAYRGHILWDELFIFPFLNLRLPEITRSLLMYRYRRLNEARVAAAEAGYRGAMYPWQSGSSGREESQRIHLNPRSGRWIPDNSRLQRHVNAAIVYNIYHYYQVTGDLEFLSFYGAEMIVEIARFWASIARYNPERDRYEILGVMGPDEYHEGYPDREEPGLDNNAYTNIMAVWVLKHALEVLDDLPEDTAVNLREQLGLKKSELDCWQEITRKMRIVFHDDGIISQFEGYDRLQEFDWDGYRKKYGDIQRLDRVLESENDTPNRYKVSKQADVLMLFYLLCAEELNELFSDLGYAFEYETIPRNIDYYLKRTSHGSTLSWVVHSWVLIRSDRLRSWDFFNQALHSDVTDIQGGTTPEGIHLGAMAGTVDILQRGFTEIVTRGDVLWLNPRLPRDLLELCLQIRYRGYFLQIEVSKSCLKVRTLSAKAYPIRIGCGQEVVELKGRESREFKLM